MKIKLEGNLVEGYLEVKDESLKDHLKENEVDKVFLRRAMLAAAISLSMKVIGGNGDAQDKIDQMAVEISRECDNLIEEKENNESSESFWNT